MALYERDHLSTSFRLSLTPRICPYLHPEVRAQSTSFSLLESASLRWRTASTLVEGVISRSTSPIPESAVAQRKFHRASNRQSCAGKFNFVSGHFLHYSLFYLKVAS